MINIHHVIILLKLLLQLLYISTLLWGKLLGVGWDANTLTRYELVAHILNPLLDSTESLVRSAHSHLALLVEELIHAKVDHLKLHLLEINALNWLELEDALVLKHK